MRQRAAHVAMWLFSRLAPPAQREALLGDLAEEHAMRANATGSSAAARWYLRQIGASVAPLLWARLTQSGWLATTGAAFVAYIAVGFVELTVNWAIADVSGTRTADYNPLGMLITFPLVVLIGYFAAGFRRRAPIVLTALMLLSVTAMTLWADERLPAWYRIAYFVVGPAATLVGSAWRRRLLSLRHT
jgi:hypothetical protein